MDRQFLHAELLLERLHHHVLICIRIRMLLLFQSIQAHFLCIAGAQLQQSELVAAHWHAELHAINFHIRLERHDDLLGKLTELGLYLSHKGSQHSFLFLLDHQLEAKVKRLHYSPSLYPEEVSECFRTIDYEREHIHIANCSIHDHGLAVVLLQRLHLVLIDLRLFELHPLGSLGHQRLVVLDNLASAAFQQRHDLLYVLVIFLLRDTSHAASLAFLDVEIQARTDLSSQDDI